MCIQGQCYYALLTDSELKTDIRKMGSKSFSLTQMFTGWFSLSNVTVLSDVENSGRSCIYIKLVRHCYHS